MELVEDLEDLGVFVLLGSLCMFDLISSDIAIWILILYPSGNTSHHPLQLVLNTALFPSLGFQKYSLDSQTASVQVDVAMC